MDHISRLLPTVLRKRGFGPLADASSVVLRAQEWMSAHMRLQAPSLLPRKLASGALVIEAANSIALSEMNRQSPALLDFLHAELPNVRVESIRCMRSSGAK